MNKREAIQLLNQEGWTKVDAQRALETINFTNSLNITETEIRVVASKFAGAELIKRQNLQRAQKAQVTKEKHKRANYLAEIENLQKQIKELSVNAQSNRTTKSQNLENKLQELNEKIKKISKENQELSKANKVLMKDNKDLKNIVDAIKLKLSIETKHLLNLENSEIKKGLVKLLESTLG